MPEPIYPGASAWLEAVDHFNRSLEPSSVHGVANRTDLVSTVARAEAERADQFGISRATAGEIVSATNLPVKEVRQIRAIFLAAGLVSIIQWGGRAETVTRRLHLPTIAPDQTILPGA